VNSNLYYWFKLDSPRITASRTTATTRNSVIYTPLHPNMRTVSVCCSMVSAMTDDINLGLYYDITADKAYDSEKNHELVRDILHVLSVMPARYGHVPIRKTRGRYRKQMKHGYSKLLYSQRNKDETIVSVIKRLFGEYITSRLVKTQNRELSFRCIAYSTHRLTNLIMIFHGFYC